MDRINLKDLPAGLIHRFDEVEPGQIVVIDSTFPTDLVLIEMQTEHIKEVAEKKGYDVLVEDDSLNVIMWFEKTK